MLELGSGTGIVAATMAAMLHANDIFFVTDLPEVMLPAARESLGMNDVFRFAYYSSKIFKDPSTVPSV
jgi:ubiquinone/menaquinone biosynthesis C-methylase UbiE